jgi:hypothetical protein
VNETLSAGAAAAVCRQPTDRETDKPASAQNPHVERWNRWMLRFRSYLASERGRSSALARHLGVRRQNVSRWFIGRGHSAGPPAWAAVAANVWYNRVVAPQVDNVPRSGDELVAPQVDK